MIIICFLPYLVRSYFLGDLLTFEVRCLGRLWAYTLSCISMQDPIDNFQKVGVAIRWATIVFVFLQSIIRPETVSLGDHMLVVFLSFYTVYGIECRGKNQQKVVLPRYFWRVFLRWFDRWSESMNWWIDYSVSRADFSKEFSWFKLDTIEKQNIIYFSRNDRGSYVFAVLNSSEFEFLCWGEGSI